MEKKPPPWTLGELAQMLNGDLHGPEDMLIVAPINSGGDNAAGIAFAEDDKHLLEGEQSGVGALLIPRGTTSAKPFIAVDAPRLAFGALLHLTARGLPINQGIHPTAVIDSSAKVDPSASIGPFVVIERNAEVGPNTRIYPFCYVGEGCAIGHGCTIYPHVVMYQDVYVGDKTVIHASTILGADGFGFFWDGEKRVKVPQVGTVRVGSSVEIGVLTAVDRATAGETSIGEGTKIDNLVQIAHNVSIGDHTVIAALAGISGSSKIGNRVVMGGSVDLSDHVSVGDDITLGGRTGVTQDLTEPGTYFGLPARPIGEALRSLMLVTKLPELVQRVRKLEKSLGNKKDDQ